ncbi:MAG: NADH-quinone oxidoreductase subunit J [Planctomycetota bacterium]|nr:MAG: NADH-quinone oxidoreductase subunit J [Planctomycetota bacterium]
MDLASIYFYLFALIALACSFGVLLARHPIGGAISLIGLMLALAGIFGVLAGPFNGTIQILVYAGAIMMLLVFVIMVLNSAQDNAVPRWDAGGVLALGLPMLFAVVVLLTLSQVNLGDSSPGTRGTIEVLAARMFDFSHGGGAFHILFLLVSLVLLVALVGAVLLAKRRLDGPADVPQVESSLDPQAQEGTQHG